MMNFLTSATLSLPVAVAIFMALDVATGILKGVAQKSIQSKLMKRGLYHKTASMLVCVVAYMTDYYAHYVANITTPVFESVCVYVIGMELFSILENLAEVNPEIGGLFHFFRHDTPENVSRETLEENENK